MAQPEGADCPLGQTKSGRNLEKSAPKHGEKKEKKWDEYLHGENQEEKENIGKLAPADRYGWLPGLATPLYESSQNVKLTFFYFLREHGEMLIPHTQYPSSY